MDRAYKEIDLGGGYSQRIYSEYKEWWLNGKRHREDEPAMVEDNDGYKEWWLNGERHREDGPAVEYADGSKEWWLNGKRHREDGPAVEYRDGYKSWWLNGELHREDGPAVELSDGSKAWYLNGINVTAETIGFIIKRKRKLGLKYWLLWTDYVMNPATERGRRYANLQYDKLEHI